MFSIRPGKTSDESCRTHGHIGWTPNETYIHSMGWDDIIWDLMHANMAPHRCVRPHQIYMSLPGAL